VHDPAAALREARRVLAPGGGVVLGLVPADGPWGEHYRRLGAAGHPYYRAARFFDRRELDELLGQAALRRARVRSALVSPAGQPPIRPGPREGDAKEAGFLAVLATPL
jgi:SAM-dependent methyltransferase